MKWIKIINLTDVCRMVQFDKRAHPPEDQMTVDEYVTWFKSGLEVFCLRDQNDDWIGSYQYFRKNENEIYFAGFAVDPDHRGHGYGQKLMSHMIRECGHKMLTCKTRNTNIVMKSLLKKNNFFRNHDEILSDDPEDHWTWWTRFPVKEDTENEID